MRAGYGCQNGRRARSDAPYHRRHTRRSAAAAGFNSPLPPAKFPRRDWERIDFGRAVSRFLSAFLRTERIICLSSQYPKPVPPKRHAERATPRFPIWPCTRWGFPCPRDFSRSGGLLPRLFTLAVGRSPRRFHFLWHFPSKSLAAFLPSISPARRRGYAASRPAEFGLSSPGLRRERFSALPKSMQT